MVGEKKDMANVEGSFFDKLSGIKERYKPLFPQHGVGSYGSYRVTAARVPTGIFGFDELIDGGFNANSINLVSGGPGTGKTILSIQYLVEGLRRNERTMYISFEEKKEKVYGFMLQFGWNLAKYERDGRFVFLEYIPEQVKKLLSEGGGLLDTIMDRGKIRRLVIDSISAFLLLEDSEKEKRESSLALFKLLKKWNCTAILTEEHASLSGKQEHRSSSSIEFETDSIILLYNIQQKEIDKPRQRFIEVLKMRGTDHINRAVPYIIKEDGVHVLPEQAVEPAELSHEEFLGGI